MQVERPVLSERTLIIDGRQAVDAAKNYVQTIQDWLGRVVKLKP